MKEIWKKIEGFENLYEVSNMGRVRHIKFNRMLKPHVVAENYLHVVLSSNSMHYSRLIHRLVAQAFIPNPDNLSCVNHKDENKSNNTVYINEDGTVDFEKSNLEWCTYKYNNNYGTRTKRISEALIGFHPSEEARKHMSEAHKGHCPSEDTRKKMSAIMRNNPKICIAILQYTKNGNLIKEWASSTEAGRVLDINNRNITSCCQGKRKTAGGYKWKYKE